MKQFLNFSCAALWLGFLLTGCKKHNDVNSYETKIDFTYNGQPNSRTFPSRILSDLIIVQNEILLANFIGLEIDDEALLGGDIFIWSKSPGAIQCAYLQPTGLSVHDVFGNCSLLVSGSDPIDSLRVYWYESSSLNFSYTDCKAVTGAIVSGQKDCAISGNFDLTLTNKNNQKIKLPTVLLKAGSEPIHDSGFFADNKWCLLCKLLKTIIIKPKQNEKDIFSNSDCTNCYQYNVCARK